MDHFKNSSKRRLRFGQEVRFVLSDFCKNLSTGSMLLDNNSIIITEVFLSIDLSAAKVFIISMYNNRLNDLVKEANKYKAYFSYNLAQKIKARRIPKLFFKADNSFDQAQKIVSILGRLQSINNINDNLS